MNLIRVTTALLLLLATLLEAAEETLVLGDGSTVETLFFAPVESAGEPTPLAIMVSGGAGSEFMARAQFWFGKELVDRGWAIAVPISPDGEPFSHRSAHLFPQLIQSLHGIHHLMQARPILVGISSGGSAAIAIAAQAPEHYLGVVAIPGRIKADTNISALHGLPVYLRVGEHDPFRWNRRLDEFTAKLEAAGAEVNAAVVPGARQIFKIDWQQLEPWLQKLHSSHP